ncbi:hypothetical protein FM106_31155 [Brachybacterium faecium]|uniref:hypothetical protein n=1 Tax=Brochothrix thermosphacta TaxID=2756 RepID=UPI000A1A5814|nr:hypothetical protein [Brochothrix thermosphacta]SLN05634.1 hypothetical protein FM106_31155 [Brachybacterium faecium]
MGNDLPMITNVLIYIAAGFCLPFVFRQLQELKNSSKKKVNVKRNKFVIYK